MTSAVRGGQVVRAVAGDFEIAAPSADESAVGLGKLEQIAEARCFGRVRGGRRAALGEHQIGAPLPLAAFHKHEPDERAGRDGQDDADGPSGRAAALAPPPDGRRAIRAALRSRRKLTAALRAEHGLNLT